MQKYIVVIPCVLLFLTFCICDVRFTFDLKDLKNKSVPVMRTVQLVAISFNLNQSQACNSEIVTGMKTLKINKSHIGLPVDSS